MSRYEMSAAIIIAILAGLHVVCCAAEPADLSGAITARAEAEKLTVGDPFPYIVTLTVPAGANVDLPGADADFSPFEIRDYHSRTTETDDGKQQITLIYELVGFEVGERQIDDFSIPVSVRDGDETIEQQYTAPPVKIVIHSVLPKNARELKPIYGPLMLLPPWFRWIKPALIILALLAAIAAVVWWWRRRSSLQDALEAVPLTFHEQALAELDSLRDDNPLDDGNFKGYYAALGDILRRWLEKRAGVQGMESTTALIRRDLRKTDFPGEWQRDLIALLRRADLA
ncbi:MAG: hypothetical protein ACLFWB_06530, partial [Armatimonadota bacterium]